MPPHDPCDRFRREHAADPRAARREPSTDGLPDHAAACAACRGWLERRVRAVQVVATLDRVPAPAALDRRVAGEITLAGLPRRHAPVVLDRLVAEELAAGTGASVARSLTQLGRLSAPAELDLRVAEALSGARRGPELRGPARRGPRPWPALLAAAALLVATLGLLPTPDGTSIGDRPQPRHRLVMLDSPAGLEPVAAGLFHGLRGAPAEAFVRAADGDPHGPESDGRAR